MKLKTFNYTDLKGKNTTRTVLVVQEPTDKLSGIDITEATEQDAIEFALAYESARQAFLSQVSALQHQFDLKHRYRQFFQHKMEVLSEEEV